MGEVNLWGYTAVQFMLTFVGELFRFYLILQF